MIIGLTGKMKSGKDTVANFIAENKSLDTQIFSMAKPLKEFCINMLGLAPEDVYTQEGKATYNTFWGMTHREILQKVGTDAMRNGFCDDVWVKIMYVTLIKNARPWNTCVIPDIRFENEADLIHALGGIVIKVERDLYVEDSHASEKDLPLSCIDHIFLNHGSLDDLKTQVNIMLKNYDLI